MYLTQRLERTFAEAEIEAKKRQDDFVSVEHLLLALVRQDGKVAEALAGGWSHAGEASTWPSTKSGAASE